MGNLSKHQVYGEHSDSNYNRHTKIILGNKTQELSGHIRPRNSTEIPQSGEELVRVFIDLSCNCHITHYLICASKTSKQRISKYPRTSALFSLAYWWSPIKSSAVSHLYLFPLAIHPSIHYFNCIKTCLGLNNSAQLSCFTFIPVTHSFLSDHISSFSAQFSGLLGYQ